nr:MAG TPA: hypothetical protein [Caudoviricetes sp.]
MNVFIYIVYLHFSYCYMLHILNITVYVKFRFGAITYFSSNAIACYLFIFF